MAEVTISARVPEALERELKDFVEKESVDRSIAVRKLLSSGLQFLVLARQMQRCWHSQKS